MQALTDGLPSTPNHKFKTLFFPDEMAQMPAYLRIRGGIVNRKVGPVPDISGKDLHHARRPASRSRPWSRA